MMENKYVSLNEYVCNYISEQIFSGKIKPGENVSERTLSKELGISRTPIREALIQLSTEGLIEKKERRGFFVKKMGLKKSKEIYEFIGVLESYIGASVVEKLNKSDIGLMKQLYNQMEDAINCKDLVGYKKLQMEFHNVFTKYCDNTMILECLNNLKLFTKLQIFYKKNETDIFDMLRYYNQGHKKIIECFEKKDKDGLYKVLKDEHWQIEFDELMDYDY